VSLAHTDPTDVGCATWNWNKQTCLQCSNNWVFNAQGVCIQVSSLCNTFDKSGACISCYTGYNLVSGACVLAPIQQVSDVGCATWNWNKQVCLACSSNWVFNSKGVCVPVSDQCNTFDKNGVCISCYVGYNLNNGKCVLAPVQQVSDVGCATWNWNKQTCLQCSSNWVFNNNGVCVPVSDQCNTYDKSGACVTCYVGYNLSNGKCVLAPIQQVSDVGCATWNWNKQTCLQCSSNWVFNNNGVCVPVSDQCNTYDKNGACVTCYVGYNLNNGKCVLAPIQQVSDVGCATWNWNKQTCLQCSSNWVFNNNGVCVPVSDQCNTYNNAGACVTCYAGYNLSNGKCVLAPIQKVSDVGCATWDWNKQVCQQCSSNWVFNNNGVCVPVSDQCNTYDKSGACVTCYKGYNLVGGACVLAPIQQVSDVGCGSWDWNKQTCLQCSARFVFNANHVCVPVSDNCNTWDNSGACTSCYSGYVLDGNSKCQVGNSLCQASNSNGACTSCYSGYILNNGNCVPISKLANLALYYSVCCPERLNQLNQAIGNSTTGA
jgi:expansin (peptidoglycan-binding protein)